MPGSTLHRVILRAARFRSGRHKPKAAPQGPLGRAYMRDRKDSFELDARPHIQSDEIGVCAG